ncbi:MAG: tRNA (guanosine(46)-N7)-methyltransferase TrmB [Clostridiales bacterium]|jgi:tRNA (guanine-N7-)-methyltransferase|nr:tRNA (guanosine(46)-N7)-methyltransferase TrmB [Clostridiales bacterium]
MRVRSKRWTEREIAENELIVENPKERKGLWNEFFTNPRPVHIDIGCGKGRFVNGMAATNPTVNYVALERERDVLVTGAKTARENGARIAFLTGDARELSEYFAPGEVARIYINFCDPWPNKKKWSKRRLTHADFLDLYASILDDDGELFFKTDSELLFNFSIGQLTEKNWRLLDISENCPADAIMTEYEEKFRTLGAPIFRLKARIH